ncbi:metallophosphoesterase family protein [Microbacterium sp. NPDC055312]
MTTTTMLLLADTHIPARARRLPRAVLDAIDASDVVVHAGDWVDIATLDLIESRSREFHGVYGNNDGPEHRERLPEIARFTVGNLRFAVIHETGPTAKREQRMDQVFADTDVLIFGHSHIPWDTVTPRGMRLLNPGSPTDRRRQPACTMMSVRIDGGALDVTLIPVNRDE